MPQTNHSSDIAGSVHELREKATDQIAKVADHVETAAAALAKHGREAGGNVQEVAGNLKGAVDTSVRDQPMATLAVIAAIGFVLGAVWKS